MDINIPLVQLLEFLYRKKMVGQKILCQPLGFYRIFLTADHALSPGLMLHAWLDPIQHKQSKGLDIHSHTFDLESRIIYGELINEIYDLELTNNGNYKLMNVFHDGNAAKRVVTEQLVEPILKSRTKVLIDETYSFNSKIFHSTVIEKYPTITLMKKTNMINQNAVNIISASHSDQELGVFQEPNFDQSEIWNRILEIIKSRIT